MSVAAALAHAPFVQIPGPAGPLSRPPSGSPTGSLVSTPTDSPASTPARTPAGPPAATAAPPAREHWKPLLSPAEPVRISTLRPADSPRRAGESDEHARVMAESGAVLPPITVHRPTMRVIDGMHRLRAAALRGDTFIPARFFEGGEADAFILAVEENTTHGLPLSQSDRTAAALRILTSHPDWSDRALSHVVGLSAKSIGQLRRSAAQLPEPASRIGRDGRSRPLDSTAGRLRASELIQRDPQASIRGIAQAAGISPGTVRDVRDRLGRGEDPVPRGGRRAGPGRTENPPDRAPGRAPGRGSAEQQRLRRSRRRAAAKDFAAMVDTLMKDPSLRHTESGRYLLRALASNAMPQGHRERLVDSVPEHCAAGIAELARHCADAWAEFADQVEQRRVSPE